MEATEWFEKHKKRILQDFTEYLAFKSISADKSCQSEIEACAEWVEHYLQKIGLQTHRLCDTPAPIIMGERIIHKDKPTILFYGHYDVQPVDPLNEWDSDPFVATMKDDRIYARGAQDNKGQSLYTMLGIQAFLEAYENSDINIKFLLEGEEEIGSPTLIKRMSEWKESVSADYALLVDSGLGGVDAPTVTIGVRGNMTCEVTVRAAKCDLHSGFFGGVARNPLMVLSKMFSQVLDKDNKVQIPGFYDDVRKVTEEERQHLDLEEHTSEFGDVLSFLRRKDCSLAEANTLQPTFEINGMWGGYTEPGFKTVIPACAYAKVSCRLVPNQEPAKIFRQVEQFLQNLAPEGVECTLQELEGAYPYWATPTSDLVQATKEVYEHILEKPVKCAFGGGTIGLTSELARYSGASVVLPGFGLASDQIHSPNENFSVRQFTWGFRMVFDILQKLQYSKTP